MKTRIRIWMCAYFLGTLALIGFSHRVFQTTDMGTDISESMWGLNLLHYSKIFEKVSRNEGRKFEKGVLEERSRDLIDPPTFSHASGIYPHGVQVTVKLPPESTGYYSLDGSVPTPRHILVTGSILVSESNVLRVKAFGKNSISPTATAEYIVSDLEQISVASLVMDPVYLFNRHAGIYANPKQKGRGWERPATLTIIDPSDDDSFSLDVRVRIHGGASRGTPNYDRKSLRVILVDQSLEFRDWLGTAASTISPNQTQWVLRHAGNKRQLWSDRFVLKIARQMGLTAGTTRPVVLHINGERWGVYDLIERINTQFLSGKEQGKDYTLLHGSPLVEPSSRSTKYAEWYQIYRYIVEADLSDPEAFAFVESQIDIVSLIDYYALSIFMADPDRPHSNIDIYRENPGPNRKNSKWRFAVWDFDGGMNYRGIYSEHDTLAWHLRDSIRLDLKPVGNPDSEGKVMATRLLRGLLQNSSFRQKFRDRFSALLATTFSSENLLSTFEEMLADYAPVVPLEEQRFGQQMPWLLEGKVRLHRGEMDFTYDDRMAEIYSFISERPGVMARLIEKHL